MKIIVGFLVTILLVPKIIKSFNNSHVQIYQVVAFNARERAILQELQIKDNRVLFLNDVTNDAAIPMYIYVAEDIANDLEIVLTNNQIQFAQVPSFTNISGFFFENHHNTGESTGCWEQEFYDFENFLQMTRDLSYKHGQVLKKRVIGVTYLKRPILMLKYQIMNKHKPRVYIVAGEEGRDWMSPAVLMNFLCHNLQEKDRIRPLLERFDLYIIPILNPDGYEYSMKEDRFWAKNRKPFFPRPVCEQSYSGVGVNIDKNWATVNYDHSECDALYPGPYPFSEQETAALANKLNEHAENTLAYINVKGFLHLITTPFGYNEPHKYDIMMQIFESVYDRIVKDHNITYIYGNTDTCFFNYQGDSTYWVKEKLNVPVIYTLYLHHPDALLPKPAHIKGLTDQFTSIIKQSLKKSHDIYGNLFNDQEHVSGNYYLLLLIFLIMKIIKT